jgi:hypothetical protein
MYEYLMHDTVINSLKLDQTSNKMKLQYEIQQSVIVNQMMMNIWSEDVMIWRNINN